MSKSVPIEKGQSVLTVGMTDRGTYMITCATYPNQDYTNGNAVMEEDDPDFMLGILMAGVMRMLTEEQEHLIEHGYQFIEEGNGPYTKIFSDQETFAETLSEDQFQLYHTVPQGEA